MAPRLGQAEVENLDASVFGDEQVFWLEIAMHDAFAVRSGALDHAAGKFRRILPVNVRAQSHHFQLGDRHFGDQAVG